MKTSEAIAKLKTMANKAGEVLYERVKLAEGVLLDKEWLDAEFKGDYDKAIDTMESECFPELSAFGLSRLLSLAKTFPEKENWKSHGFNLMRLWAEHEDRRKAALGDKPHQERPRAKIADLEEKETKIKELEWSAKQTREIVQAKEIELTKKETEIERLRRENDELRGEVKALNRMLEQLRRVAA